MAVSNQFNEIWQAAKEQGLIPDGNEFTISIPSEATSVSASAAEWWEIQPGRENGPILEQQFLDNQPLTFADLMALYAWSSAGWEAADRARNYEQRSRFSKLSGAVRPACVRAEKHGTSFLDDRNW
jgi:hypothetical protein